jgi:hypothetical protein
MLLRNRKPDSKTLVRFGMLALAISIAWPHLIPAGLGMSENLIDGVKGAFLGMALALLIWGAKLGGFSRPIGKQD